MEKWRERERQAEQEVDNVVMMEEEPAKEHYVLSRRGGIGASSTGPLSHNLGSGNGGCHRWSHV